MSVTVVKVGGSLALYPDKLRALCNQLSASSKSHRLFIVPGGGEFADVVRNLDKRYSLSDVAAHRMAILGMDQYGFMLADLIPNGVTITALEQAESLWGSGKLPILLPSNLMFKADGLENSWNVTSDSIAMYMANQLYATKLVLITDVDGVYIKDPKKFGDAQFLPRTSAKELLALGNRTSVDKALPKLLSASPMTCFVVNGLFAERVQAVLDDELTVCTELTGLF
jgi:5-(aminomethyl)-3-furanmethanol phosphate kinase